MTTKTTPGAPDVGADPSHRLKGKLGPAAIVFMVVAAAAPLTVIAGTVPLGISAGNGAAFPASYLVCTVILLFFAVGFTAMAKHIPGAGAFYTYVTQGLGRHSGLGAAFLALLSYTAVQGAVYGYIGAAVNDFVTSHGGPELPWYAWALAVMVVVAVLGYRHIDLSGKVLGVLLVCEVGIVLVIDAAVVIKGGGEAGLSTTMFNPGQFFTGAPGIALIFAVAGYIGFEATAVFRDEARDPSRTIPRATYLALLIIGGFYALSSWALVSAWGDEGAVALATENPEGMITETATKYVGTAAGDLVQIFLITSLFAALLSFHNVLARYIFSLGNSNALPALVGRSHAKHSSPHIASTVQTVSALVLVARRGVRRAGPGDSGVRLVRRCVVGGHRRPDGVDVHRGTGLLPTLGVRNEQVEDRHRTHYRPGRSCGAVVHDRHQPAAAGRWIDHPGLHHRRRPVGHLRGRSRRRTASSPRGPTPNNTHHPPPPSTRSRHDDHHRTRRFDADHLGRQCRSRSSTLDAHRRRGRRPPAPSSTRLA